MIPQSDATHLRFVKFCLQDLDVGAKNVKLYVNKNLTFDGQLDKGDGEAPAELTVLVGLNTEKTEGMEDDVNAHSGESRGARTVVGTGEGEELRVVGSQPAGAAVDLKVSPPGALFGERTHPPDCTEDTLSKLEDDFSLWAAPDSVEGEPGAPAPGPPVQCPPLDQELALIQQLENLAGRKVSEPPGKTPSWLQPSPTGRGRKQGGKKPKPLWLSPEKPLDWKDSLLPEDIVGEGPAEAQSKGPRREQGRASSWNVISGERAQRVTPKVCSDDFDIFNQPSNRERPASGRRGPKKDALSSNQGGGPPPGRGKLDSGLAGSRHPCRRPLTGTMPLCSLDLVSSSAKQGVLLHQGSLIYCLGSHVGSSSE